MAINAVRNTLYQRVLENGGKIGNHEVGTRELVSKNGKTVKQMVIPDGEYIVTAYEGDKLVKTVEKIYENPALRTWSIKISDSLNNVKEYFRTGKYLFRVENGKHTLLNK